MAESPLAAKLQIPPGSRLLVVNAPEGYLDRLQPLPEGVELVEVEEGAVDAVHLFVRDSAELDRAAPATLRAVKPDGLVWISYPKRASGVETDLTRDVGWETVKGEGLRPVRQVSVDDTWSALRFRPADQVSSTR
jgi:hypothetical protein